MSDWALLDKNGNIVKIIKAKINNTADLDTMKAQYAQLLQIADIQSVGNVPIHKLKAYEFLETIQDKREDNI